MADMHRINLLPDIKQERLQQQRQEQYARLAALAVIIGMGALALVMGGAALYQRQSLISTQESIENEQAAIAEIENRQELVGMQTALEELPALSEQKLFASQLPEIMEQVVPEEVNITFLEYASGGEMELIGESRSYRDIYTFVDALEKVEGTVTLDGQEQRSARFFSRVEFMSSSAGEDITFSVNATLDESFLSAAHFTEADDE